MCDFSPNGGRVFGKIVEVGCQRNILGKDYEIQSLFPNKGHRQTVYISVMH